MAFTVRDFHDMIRILEERPEWRDELRRLILSDELLELPAIVQRLAEAQSESEERIKELIAQVRELTRRVDELTAQMSALTGRVSSMAGDVGELKGIVLEQRYRDKAPAYFRELLRGIRLLSPREVSDLADRGVEEGRLSEEEAKDLVWADLVAKGRRREDGREAYIVVEVSWGIGVSDVERAARRAELLRRLGLPNVIPVVAGKGITGEASELAEGKGVVRVIDGRAIKP